MAHKPLGPKERVPTLCLTMIVKNESPRMIRLLDTLIGVIDEVVISDTGSTDDTIDITRKKCKDMGLPFFVDETPFKDFSHNRSRSITVAVEQSKCDYLLFLDADMKIAKGSKYSKRALLEANTDVFSFMQKGCGLEYYNMRVMRRTLKGLKCVGLTHEHYACDEPTTTTNVLPEILFIDDIGDGGSKADKFTRDYRLLTRGLEEEPTNIRYMFYLAETCRHEKKYDESIKWYKKRIKAGGWDEEIYCSYYGITMCYMEKGDSMKADAYGMKSFMFRPSRTEALYALCKWHRERRENGKAYSFYQLGHRVPKPDDVLFVQTAPYSWAWDHEFAILAFYMENSKGGLLQPLGNSTCLMKIMSSLRTANARGSLFPDYIYDQIIENMKHYIELLPAFFPRSDMLPNMIKTYRSSTPGIVRLITGPTMETRVIRYARQVDYKIVKANGSYLLGPGGKIRSTCSMQVADGPWKELKTVSTGVKLQEGAVVQGIEDIRFFNMANSEGSLPSTMSDDSVTGRILDKNPTHIYGLGTSQEYAEGPANNQMILIEVDLENMLAYPIKRIPRVYGCEKNHAPIARTNLCVHSWGPRLVIYDLVKTGSQKLHITHEFPENQVPGIFRSIRGSSCGIPFPSVGPPREYWFVCHSVFHETPRNYVHYIVRLNAETLRPLGITIPFHFDEYKIEFVGGIDFGNNDKTLIVGYSIFDSSSREIHIPITWILQKTLPFVMDMKK